MKSFQPPISAAPLPPRSRRREWLGLALVIALPVGLLVAAAALINHFVNRDWDEANAAADRELAEAIADADRLDPGWRLDELTARRKNLADEENAAMRVIAVKESLPACWPAPSGTDANDRSAANDLARLEGSLEDLPPERELDADQVQQLRQVLSTAGRAVGEARKLADQPAGRYAIDFKPDFFSTFFPTQQCARDICQLLWLDVALLAQERDVDKALASVRAGLNVARSLGDEPTHISQLIRLACRTTAIRSLERVLAQGEPSIDALAAVQQVLEQEDAFPALLVAARGERAGLHMLMENLESGVVPKEQLLSLVHSGRSNPHEPKPEIALDPVTLKTTHAWMLRWLNDYVETVKRPPWEWDQPFLDLNQRLCENAPPLACLLLPAPIQVPERFRRSHASLRCALTAVAIERFRRAQHTWPTSLKTLEGRFVPQVPINPYEGQPLYYLRPTVTDRGASVYSTGETVLVTRSDIENKSTRAESRDFRFQLWNPNLRGQSPAAKPKEVP
jgi:hypothetical protein